MTDEKPLFICDIPGCDKRFGRNCELTRHKLNHMDVWPFSCDVNGCGRKFKRKDVFKNHQRTHAKDFALNFPASMEPSQVNVHVGSSVTSLSSPSSSPGVTTRGTTAVVEEDFDDEEQEAGKEEEEEVHMI